MNTNMAHLEIIANSVNSNGRCYGVAEHMNYDVCAVKTKGGVTAFAVPCGKAPKQEDIEGKKVAEIEKIIIGVPSTTKSHTPVHPITKCDSPR